MAFSYKNYQGDGSTTIWNIPFEFLSRDDVSVFNVDDQSPVNFVWLTDSQIEVTPAVASDVVFRIQRVTPIDKRVIDFQDATVLDEADLDTSANQNFYVAQELLDTVEDKMALIADGTWDGRGQRISNVADPVDDQDVATKGWSNQSSESNLGLTIAARDEAQQSATAASLSEQAAALSEANASNSEQAAALSETNAGISEVAAAQSATDANSSALVASSAETGAVIAKDAAEAAQEAAETAFDSFDDRYLGEKTSDPLTDNDGDSLLEGAIYWNSTTKRFRVYSTVDTTWHEFPLLTVAKTSANGAAELPSGTTADRPSSPQPGNFRYNEELAQFEGYGVAGWGGVGGASGGGGNPFVYENDSVVTVDYEITTGKNAVSVGPLTIADGVTVTVPVNSVWVIL